MKHGPLQIRLQMLLRRFERDENGTTVVELAVVMPLFLLLFFGLIDFGRMAFHYVTAEKAMQVAARVAAVRAPACASVPLFYQRPSSGAPVPPPAFGTSCSAGANICAAEATVQCSGTTANATSNEIWALIRGALPNNATVGNLRFIYTQDPNIGFLGGPYVPVVTVELQNLNFEFVSPLGALVGLTGATASGTLGADIPFPTMSVSLPAEDLDIGDNG
jgi:hypothetical protein